MRIILFVMMFIVSITFSAQTKVHTVQRGETVASVAKKYGISVDELKNANPNVNNHFYIGMSLIIPANKTALVHSEEIISSQQKYSIGNNNDAKQIKVSNSNENRTKHHANNSLDGSDFRSAGILFGSDFSDLVGLTYGVQGQYFLKNNFGATLNFGLNHGIEKNSDMVIKIGPSYVYPIYDWLYVMATACYTLSLVEGKGGSGNVSGASFIPTIGIAIKQLRIGLNGEARWRNGGTFGPGAFLSISYAF